jgi:hypothetical protein
MKLIETHEYKFPSHLLAPLVNGDPVDEEDRESFEEFVNKLERYKKEYNATDYTINCNSDSYFSWSNCLNGLGCEVTDIQVHYLNN